jgi:hypothetical protein
MNNPLPSGDIDLTRNGDVYRYVRDYFARSSNETHRMIANDLARLRISRNRADYDDIMTQLPVLARISLKLAARVLANLDELLLQNALARVESALEAAESANL